MKRIVWIVAFVAFFWVLGGCKQDTRIGFELVQDDEILSSTDTIFGIKVRTIGQDTVRTDNTGYVSFGQVEDPIFGKTKAEFAIQFNLSGSIPYKEKDSIKSESNSQYEYFYHSFGREPKADSIVLFLVNDTASFSRTCIIGDQQVPQELDIRLLKDTLSPTNYNTSKIAEVITDKSLSELSYKYTPESNIYTFKIDNLEYVDTFLNSNTFAFDSKEKFRDIKMKGFAFINNTSSPSFLSRFDLNNSGTKLRMYYTNKELREKDSSALYDFKVDVGTNRSLAYTRYFSELTHNYAGSELENKVDNETAIDSEKIYIQPLAGVRSLLTLPELRSWLKDKNKLVRFVQLVVRPVDSDLNDMFPALDRISIYKAAENGKMDPLYGYLDTQNNKYYSEEYDPIDNEFRFDITRYVQEIADAPETEGMGLILTAEARAFSFGRTTLHSANTSLKDYQMFVKITYSSAAN